MKRFTILAAWLVCACLPVAFAADTLESVEKAIVEKNEKLTSIQFRSVTNQELSSPQFTMKTDSESTVEAAKKGDVWMFRAEAKTKSSQKMGDQETKSDQATLMVCDGKFNYVLSDTAGQKQAMKMAMSQDVSMISNKKFFDQLRKDHELKLLADEKAEGKDAWVVEATPKNAASSPMMSKMKFYFDKDSGMTVQVIGLNAEGKPMSTTVNKDIKINASIPDDRFTFKAPEGVTVMDMTSQQPATPPSDKPEGGK
ncbi:MAG: outer membrane lipoprotein carrier protein LolA [Phycisphaerales bacterium]|nr:outer membrane lipoprotein carrier protein LolA [Phycisphaerales bacterium]